MKRKRGLVAWICSRADWPSAYFVYRRKREAVACVNAVTAPGKPRWTPEGIAREAGCPVLKPGEVRKVRVTIAGEP